MNRAEYLKHHLSKTLSADVIEKQQLRYSDVMNASSTLLEYWTLVRKADVDNAIAQPEAEASARRSKEAAEFRKFQTGEGWEAEDQQRLVQNLERLKVEFPALISNRETADTVANYLLEQNRPPTYENIVSAVQHLAPLGRVLLNPSAVGIPEDRYGDSVFGDYQISQVTADDLRLMTTPYKPRPADESQSADAYWAAHPELAAERYKHSRAAVQAQAVANADAEVERFLMTQLNYEPTANNKKLMLEYLESHNLPFTAEALFEAFNALKAELAQSDKGVSYGMTTVVDFGERNQNPSYITNELKETIRRKIARYDSGQYNEWLIRHPEEAAILDEQ